MGKICRIMFEPMGISTEVSSNTSIWEAAGDMNIPVRSDCGGKGLCGKCRLIAEPANSLSEMSEQELDILSPGEIKKSYRLACQARIQGDVTITVPEKMMDSREAKGKTGLSGFYPLDPLIERIVIPKNELPKSGQGISMDLAGWAEKKAKAITDRDIYIKDLDALMQLSLPSVSEGDMTIVNHSQRGVTAILAGSRLRTLGCAVDIGTTTLAAYLCDMSTGEVLTSAASVNPQRRYGEDVMSRIAMADRREDGLEKLQNLVIDGINYLITRCVEEVGATRDEIDEVTLVGNTTMEMIFAGFHPYGLGVSPYMPVLRSSIDLKAREVGLAVNPGTNLYLFPVVSGFVGGNTVAAIVAEKPYLKDEICLIVDIGTNGELVLGNREKLWATSCATGPAFEGAQITCGMRAVSGAIYKVEVDPLTGQPSWSVFGDGDDIPPVGICGSGLIDAMAVMRKIGVLLPSGRLNEGKPGVISDAKGIGREYVLVPAEKSGTKKNISIMLHDVRQFQLAKSALSVGIQLLMLKANVKRVDRLILTGAFGSRFNWRNAVETGMFPRESAEGDVLSLDNLAGVGAITALLDKKQREEADRLSQTTRFIELAMDPEFTIRFPKATRFPDIK